MALDDELKHPTRKQAQTFSHEGLALDDEDPPSSTFDLATRTGIEINAGIHTNWRNNINNSNNNTKTTFIANNNQRQASNPPPYSQIGNNNLLLRLFLAEFLGTFIFVYLGQCIITSFELSGTQSEASVKLFASLICQSVALLMSIWLTISVSGGHLNPAYTMASAAFGLMKWSQVPVYLMGQYGGSFLAACFIHITYNDKIAHRHAEGLLNGMNMTLRAHGNILSSGKFFTTFPPIEVSLTQLFISYTLATAQFSLMAATIYENHLNNNHNPHNRHPTNTATKAASAAATTAATVTATNATCCCSSSSCFSSVMDHHNYSSTITSDDNYHDHHRALVWPKNHLSHHLSHPPSPLTAGLLIGRLPKYLQPVYLSLAWLVSQAAFSANGGPVLNPAADFSPRLYISISGWGAGSFNLYCFTYWWLCGLVAPHLGAFIGLALHRVIVTIHLPYGGGGGSAQSGSNSCIIKGCQQYHHHLNGAKGNGRFVGDTSGHSGSYLNGNNHHHQQQMNSSFSHHEQQVPASAKPALSEGSSGGFANSTMITSQSPFLQEEAIASDNHQSLNHHHQDGQQQANMSRQDRQRASTATLISNISCGARSNVSNTADNMRQHQKFLEKYQQNQQDSGSAIK